MSTRGERGGVVSSEREDAECTCVMNGLIRHSLSPSLRFCTRTRTRMHGESQSHLLRWSGWEAWKRCLSHSSHECE